MQTINNPVHLDTSLSCPWMTTRQLLDLLRKHSDTHSEIKIEIDDKDGRRKHVLTGVEDIEKHLSIIRIPLTVTINNIRLDVRKIGCEIFYKDEDEGNARALLEDLRGYQPWFRYFFSGPLVGLVPAFITYISWIMISPEGPEWIIPIAIGGASILIMTPLSLYVARPRLTHVVRDTFFSRNIDKVFVGMIMLILGILISKVPELISHIFPESQ